MEVRHAAVGQGSGCQQLLLQAATLLTSPRQDDCVIPASGSGRGLDGSSSGCCCCCSGCCGGHRLLSRQLALHVSLQVLGADAAQHGPHGKQRLRPQQLPRGHPGPHISQQLRQILLRLLPWRLLALLALLLLLVLAASLVLTITWLP